MQSFKLLLIDSSESKAVSEEERRFLAKGQWQLRVASYTGSLPLDYHDASWDAVIWHLEKSSDLKAALEEAYRLVVAEGTVLLTATLNARDKAKAVRTAKTLSSTAEMMTLADGKQLLRLKKPAAPLTEVTTDQKISGCPGLMIDQAIYTDYALLCLYGWSPSPARLVRRLTLIAPGTNLDITQRIHRISRPDLTDAFPMLRGDNFGIFALLVVTPEQIRGAKLCLETLDSDTIVVPLQLRHVEWSESAHLICSLWPQALSDLPYLIQACQALKISQTARQIAHLSTELMATHHASLPVVISEPAEQGFFALDRAWALGAGGLLLMGWRFDPYCMNPRIHLHTPNGQSVDITDRLFSVPRPDVAQAHRSRFPDIPEDTGFICHVRLPTAPGDVRLIELRSTSGPICWLRLPDTRNPLTGLALVREILSWVPQPQRMHRRLHALFEDQLGPAIHSIAPSPPPSAERVETLVFGNPPDKPRVSVLIPLYGRYDFLRHQLAQFADDPDFQSVDLLYLVDDPNILTDTLDLAAAMQPLFGIPFRVAHAGVNLGYAAINNLGARLARADTLLLLNSDVIPLHPGWLGTLLEALEHLPDAGAVAPLLLFPEGAVQHAGMVVGKWTALPGFLSILHPGKGQPWTGSDTPSEQAMLTAACLLLRTADYQVCGGLDEGYWVGDFEDSDLCLALRQRGKRLYLTPQARLCHLERQSQKISEFGDLRMLLTLFNSWRFSNKIRTGQLLDPRTLMETEGLNP